MKLDTEIAFETRLLNIIFLAITFSREIVSPLISHPPPPNSCWLRSRASVAFVSKSKISKSVIAVVVVSEIFTWRV